MDQKKLWEILQEMGIPDHLTCLLRNLYAGQEATVRTGHGTTDWFQIGKGVHQGCMLSPCLFNLYAEYIMRKAGLEEVEAGIKIAGRNINNLRYADDTTLMAESEEELKSLLMKVIVSSSPKLSPLRISLDPLGLDPSTVLCCCCCLGASVVSDSVRPHRWQPTRLPRPWDSPGKNTGVGCHFLLQILSYISRQS